MAHIYMSFDFGTDEEKAQQARHKLEMWKQAFRLDKKLLYKFERSGGGSEVAEDAGAAPKPGSASAKKEAAKSPKPGKAKAKAESGQPAASNGTVKLYLRLAFSGHERMTEERLLKKFPSEQPFSELSPKAVKHGDSGFGELEEKFDSLE
jgi:hypothetical protein